MKVILLENLRRIGSIGEIIDVKRGFARNFLISNKKALYASKENIAEVEKIKSELSKKDTEKKKEAQKISEQIHLNLYHLVNLSVKVLSSASDYCLIYAKMTKEKKSVAIYLILGF